MDYFEPGIREVPFFFGSLFVLDVIIPSRQNKDIGISFRLSFLKID
jgi:hypothetical protein